ncbi:MAG TPA: non-canonical purine NTP pyrophosphatase, partial [Vicinamibacterales bacterium]|nr:non-canonical purine NTP pyrophosphatase [Vicinamibacterales bacterium]
SGLSVPALGGAPGVRSARFAGPDAGDRANIAKLLVALAGLPREQRGASFHCVLVALLHADDPAPVVAAGEWSGEIMTAPRGAHGFGYDPLFFDPMLCMTAAELPAPLKNRVSHRGTAVRRLSELLQKR